MSFRKIAFYIFGIGLLTFLIKQLFSLFGGGLRSYDVDYDANPSPPARKQWY